MAGNPAYRPWHYASPSPSHSASQRHLIELLSPLHDEPEILATRLLHRFGSISRIVHASESELRQAAELGEHWVDTLLVVRQLIHDGMRETLTRSPLGAKRQELLQYLLLMMRNLSEERMVAIFADHDGYVISEEVLAEGTESHVILTPRRIFSRALKLDAHRIVLAHNHPSGCSDPSRRDIEFTRRLSGQARELGLTIDDHYIVGKRDVTSMKDRGLF